MSLDKQRRVLTFGLSKLSWVFNTQEKKERVKKVIKMGVRWPLPKKERKKAKVRLQPSKIKQNCSGDWGQCTNNVTGVNVLRIAVVLAIKAAKRSAVRSNLLASVLFLGGICKHHCTQTFGGAGCTRDFICFL